MILNRLNTRNKSIVCIETNQTYKDCYEVMEQVAKSRLGINRLYNACKFGTMFLGYHWKMI